MTTAGGPADLRDHIVICGLGGLALRLVEDLRRTGEDVVVVGLGFTEWQREAIAGLGAHVVDGALDDSVVLRHAGVDRATAIAAVADDDVGNLRCAFTAQKLNAALRVVVRLFNEDMGERIQHLFEDCVILSASAIAAPFFVAAALGEVEGDRIGAAGRALLATHEHHREVEEREAPVLLSLARVGDDDRVQLFPGDVAEGDLVLRDLGEFETADEDALSRRIARVRRPMTERLLRSGATVRALFDRRFRLLLLLLGTLIAVGTAVFAVAKSLPPVVALYFTVVTVATVGYGDINLQGDPTWLQVFGVAFILVGATIIAIFYALLIDALVGVRLARILGTVRGRMRRHVIVCGLGNLGFRVVERLALAGVAVVAVERNESSRHVPAVRRLGIPVVVGDASLAETLHSAHVETADCVVTCTDDDVTDLEAAVCARSLHPHVRVILRLYDIDMTTRVRSAFAIDISRSVWSIAAPVFATALLRHSVVATIAVRRETLVVTELEVLAGSRFEHASRRDVEAGAAVRVVAIARPGDLATWLPEPDHHIDALDRLVVVATRSELRRITEGCGMAVAVAEPAPS